MWAALVCPGAEVEECHVSTSGFPHVAHLGLTRVGLDEVEDGQTGGERDLARDGGQKGGAWAGKVEVNCGARGGMRQS